MNGFGEHTKADADVMEMHPARLLRLTQTSRLARTVVLYDEVDSTNRAASEAAAMGAPEGTVVVAERQTAGKGRKGRSWFSTPRGSIVFSMILRPKASPESLTTLLGLSAALSIEKNCPGVKVGIKWPNDLYIAGRKVAGILAESRGSDVIVGIGIDINDSEDDFPARLRETAISLFMATGNIYDRGKIFSSILEIFESFYSRWEREGLSVFKFDVESRLVWKGKEAIIESGGDEFIGKILGITSEGYLRIDVQGEEKVFQAGDLRLSMEMR